MQRAVVVLGGNAFAAPDGRLTMPAQLRFAHRAVAGLAPLLTGDTQLLISHGNGPQVGHILTRVEEALGKAYAIPLEVCVAESEGELGYVLEQSLYNVLAGLERARPIASLLTQVVVDPDDPAFSAPTKPIGPFYEAAEAEALRGAGFAVVEDAGRGYRRVVPSPQPREILQLDVIRMLLEQRVLVIAAGGGGIPVVRRDAVLQGIEAVVDKDLTAALAAEQLEAELLVILTTVPCAFRNFRTPEQQPIGRIGAAEARELLNEGHFAPGSMRPKMEAAARFASRGGCRAVICNPDNLVTALAGVDGTIVEGP